MASNPLPVFLPGEFHGQRSLGGYSPWGHKELDKTEHIHTHSLTACFSRSGVVLFIFTHLST